MKQQTKEALIGAFKLLLQDKKAGDLTNKDLKIYNPIAYFLRAEKLVDRNGVIGEGEIVQKIKRPNSKLAEKYNKVAQPEISRLGLQGSKKAAAEAKAEEVEAEIDEQLEAQVVKEEAEDEEGNVLATSEEKPKRKPRTRKKTTK